MFNVFVRIFKELQSINFIINIYLLFDGREGKSRYSIDGMMMPGLLFWKIFLSTRASSVIVQLIIIRPLLQSPSEALSEVVSD